MNNAVRHGFRHNFNVTNIYSWSRKEGYSRHYKTTLLYLNFASPKLTIMASLFFDSFK
jgi:hypothetical protein